jgi:hypothetical protein
MPDSQHPPASPGGTKFPLIIVIAGIVILIFAGLILFRNRFAAPDPPVEKTEVTQKKATAPSMLIQEPSRPRNGNGQDRTDGEKAKGEDRKTKREPIGKINVAAVNTFINMRFGQVKACYERRLKVDSTLEGTLDLNINLASSGKVTAVTVNRNTVRDAEMLSCVRRTIRRWDFPKPEWGRVVIAKTFRFKKKR